MPAVALELLGEKTPRNAQKPAINGWKKKGTDLPVLVTNSSNQTEYVPGRVSPHRVAVHPTPTEFVAVAWKSPLDGQHPHQGQGRPRSSRMRQRHRLVAGAPPRRQAAVLAEGAVNVGGEATVGPRSLKVAKGDRILLVVDARNGDHSCDLTEITLTIAETEKPARTWDLAGDIADTVLDGNPHADRLGNKEVWSFVKGPTRPVQGLVSGPAIPAESVAGALARRSVGPGPPR